MKEQATDREVPAVRVLPMSEKVRGFGGKSIVAVQEEWFLKKLPAGGGRWQYTTTGLKAEAGTVVLFQFQGRVIASAVFLRDERFEKPRNGSGGCRGVLHFQAGSFRVFEPVDAASMRAVWPGFRGFGQVKQRLNPGRYAAFEAGLKRVRKARVPGRVKGRG